MKSIALLLLLIGIILIVLGISKTNNTKCPTDIEYRTVSNNYLEDVLSSRDNYKDIFDYTNLGVPNNVLDKGHDTRNDDTEENIHNML